MRKKNDAGWITVKMEVNKGAEMANRNLKLEQMVGEGVNRNMGITNQKGSKKVGRETNEKKGLKREMETGKISVTVSEKKGRKQEKGISKNKYMIKGRKETCEMGGRQKTGNDKKKESEKREKGWKKEEKRENQIEGKRVEGGWAEKKRKNRKGKGIGKIGMGLMGVGMGITCGWGLQPIPLATVNPPDFSQREYTPPKSIPIQRVKVDSSTTNPFPTSQRVQVVDEGEKGGVILDGGKIKIAVVIDKKRFYKFLPKLMGAINSYLIYKQVDYEVKLFDLSQIRDALIFSRYILYYPTSVAQIRRWIKKVPVVLKKDRVERNQPTQSLDSYQDNSQSDYSGEYQPSKGYYQTPEGYSVEVNPEGKVEKGSFQPEEYPSPSLSRPTPPQQFYLFDTQHMVLVPTIAKYMVMESFEREKNGGEILTREEMGEGLATSKLNNQSPSTQSVSSTQSTSDALPLQSNLKQSVQSYSAYSHSYSSSHSPIFRNVVFGGLDLQQQVAQLSKMDGGGGVAIVTTAGFLPAQLTKYEQQLTGGRDVYNFPKIPYWQLRHRTIYANLSPMQLVQFLSNVTSKLLTLTKNGKLAGPPINRVLTSQLAFSPVIIELTQPIDRQQLILANSVDPTTIIPSLKDTSLLMEGNIFYNWLGYTSQVLLNRIYNQTTGRDGKQLDDFGLEIDNGKVVYRTQLYQIVERGFRSISPKRELSPNQFTHFQKNSNLPEVSTFLHKQLEEK